MAQPAEPPRLTGDLQRDVVALNEYIWTFYRDVVRDNEYATTAAVQDLEANKVDPANATAATAQQTANTALAVANQNKATLDDQQAGSFTVNEGNTTADVTFSNPQPDTSYFVVCSVSGISGAPATNSRIINGITKTTTGFTATLLAAPGVGTSVTFDWVVMR